MIPDSSHQDTEVQAILLDGPQAAAIFRHLTLTGTQAVKNGIRWWFEGGIVLSMQDGEGVFWLSATPTRGACDV